MGTDKYHIQVSDHRRAGKNALNEYDQYAIYLAILNHDVIDMSICDGISMVANKSKGRNDLMPYFPIPYIVVTNTQY